MLAGNTFRSQISVAESSIAVSLGDMTSEEDKSEYKTEKTDCVEGIPEDDHEVDADLDVSFNSASDPDIVVDAPPVAVPPRTDVSPRTFSPDKSNIEIEKLTKLVNQLRLEKTYLVNVRKVYLSGV